MVKKALLLAVVLVGCGDRVSLGQHGSGTGPLSVEEPEQKGRQSGGSTPPSAAPDGNESTATPVTPDLIEYIEVDEISPRTRKIRVDASCRVTDDTGLDAIGETSRCRYLFDVSVVLNGQDCGPLCLPDACTGTVLMHLKDGRELVRDLSADKCSVYFPSVPTHKHTYDVWYSAGGVD